MIVVLTDEDGLQFLFLDFRRCENTLDSKEYYFKYQGQTVIGKNGFKLKQKKIES